MPSSARSSNSPVNAEDTVKGDLHVHRTLLAFRLGDNYEQQTIYATMVNIGFQGRRWTRELVLEFLTQNGR